MMIGTAGHIDHGKTSLVRALTGTDTDRLPEEKKRGMSIELGFAFLEDGKAGPERDARISGKVRIGFIDVPGHEKLLHTMIAGATGIDFALLVVAADDGVMPQTREHLAVLSLLGVRRGIVALTKTDRVDAARVAEVTADITALLAPTPLADARIVPVSTVTGAGIDELRHWLVAEARCMAYGGTPRPWIPPLPPGMRFTDRRFIATPSADVQSVDGENTEMGVTEVEAAEADPVDLVEVDSVGVDNAAVPDPAAGENAHGFRLAIDRAFTLDGVGTVVTGTVHGGQVQVGDVLMQMPGGPDGLRVRSLHAQNRSTGTAHTGQRCAINLAGVERDVLQRGHWVAQPDIVSVSDRLDVELTLWHEEPRALRSGTRVHVHLGTTSSPAAVAVLDGCVSVPAPGEGAIPVDTLAPGRTGLVQLVLPQPLAAWHGDRLIVRDAAGQRIIGGGRVLTSLAPVRYRRTPQRLALLRALQQPALQDRLAGLLAVSDEGVDLAQWQRVFGLASVAVFDALLDPLCHRRLSGAFVMGEAAWQRLSATVLQTLAHYHETATEEIGPDAARLRRLARLRLDDAHWRLVLDVLAKEGLIALSGAFVHLPGHGTELAARDQALLERLMPSLMEADVQGAWVRDLAEAMGEQPATLRPAMARLARGGYIYPIVKDLYITAATAAKLAAIVRRLAQENVPPPDPGQQGHGQPVLTVAAFRDASGLGRKRAVQVLEFFDRIGLCRRVGDAHILRTESLLFRA